MVQFCDVSVQLLPQGGQCSYRVFPLAGHFCIGRLQNFVELGKDF